MNNLRIMLVGKICGDDFDWTIVPVPAPPMTDANSFVSRYMNSVPMLDTPGNLWWDGFYSFCEDQPLAAMPTEYQEQGWWAARLSNGERDRNRFDGDIEDDAEWIRRGC